MGAQGDEGRLAACSDVQQGVVAGHLAQLREQLTRAGGAGLAVDGERNVSSRTRVSSGWFGPCTRSISGASSRAVAIGLVMVQRPFREVVGIHANGLVTRVP